MPSQRGFDERAFDSLDGWLSRGGVGEPPAEAGDQRLAAAARRLCADAARTEPGSAFARQLADQLREAHPAQSRRGPRPDEPSIERGRPPSAEPGQAPGDMSRGATAGGRSTPPATRKGYRRLILVVVSAIVTLLLAILLGWPWWARQRSQGIPGPTLSPPTATATLASGRAPAPHSGQPPERALATTSRLPATLPAAQPKLSPSPTRPPWQRPRGGSVGSSATGRPGEGLPTDTTATAAAPTTAVAPPSREPRPTPPAATATATPTAAASPTRESTGTPTVDGPATERAIERTRTAAASTPTADHDATERAIHLTRTAEAGTPTPDMDATERAIHLTRTAEAGTPTPDMDATERAIHLTRTAEARTPSATRLWARATAPPDGERAARCVSSW